MEQRKSMIIVLTIALTVASYALSAWLIYSLSADLYRVNGQLSELQAQIATARKAHEASKAELESLQDEFHSFRHSLEDDGK